MKPRVRAEGKSNECVSIITPDFIISVNQQTLYGVPNRDVGYLGEGRGFIQGDPSKRKKKKNISCCRNENVRILRWMCGLTRKDRVRNQRNGESRGLREMGCRREKALEGMEEQNKGG